MSLPYFDHPWLLGLAVVLPVAVVLLIVLAARRRRRRLAALGEADVISRLIPAAATRRPGWRAARLGAACRGSRSGWLHGSSCCPASC